MSGQLGISGRIARRFLGSELTPLLALAALLLGVFAALITPREEEPQIDVTFANVFVPFPGASAREVEDLVSTPLERMLSQMSGIDHIYSTSSPGLATLSVQFKVGVPRTEALVRLYDTVYSHADWRPANAGILPPLIKPKGIDDVPVVTLTLWTRDPARGSYALGELARSMQSELQRIAGVREVQTIGDPQTKVTVRLDPQKLAGYGLTVSDLSQALLAANVVQHAGSLVGADQLVPVDAGGFLASREDVAGLIVGMHAGRPVYLQDVSDVQLGADQPSSYVWFGSGPGAAAGATQVVDAPAVTIAVSKKPGVNAIGVARQVIARVQRLRRLYLPRGVEVSVTRNYGLTANDKADKLIEKLIFATTSVVLLVVLTMGWREALVVGAAVTVTLAATLFASWAWGFTINRVSLFALIFSIGILVDDAIVVAENVHRHRQLEGGALSELIPRAVDEVGGPTILATLTVIAALLPMAFVSGLMGPYMSPIPINASMGMLISLAVALTLTPWLCRVLLTRERADAAHEVALEERSRGRIERLFDRAAPIFLTGARGRRNRHRLYGGLAIAIVLAIGLVVSKLVVLKMLPFDNKSEFQVVADLPVGTPVETTARLLSDLSAVVARVPEVSDYEAYAGTAAPINFNGLVRQYYLRQDARFGDLQVNLIDKRLRHRQSHEIALSVRAALAAVGRRYGASVQVVEVPPGPPVRAPIVAEVYGPSYPQQRALGLKIRALFEHTPSIVDIDDSIEAPSSRLQFLVDRQKAALLGISQAQIVQTLAAGLEGTDVTYARIGRGTDPVPVHLELPAADTAGPGEPLALQVRSQSGERVALSELVHVEHLSWDGAIYHKDLLPVVYVTGDAAGKLDSPLYGMFDMVGGIRRAPPGGSAITQYFTHQPPDDVTPAIKWDGEWQITYETFRDMGLAYSVGLVLIYLLVVAQFRSYALPLIIMAPIPLTIIGVMPGHALLHAQFTATSMIGMIALAGIIVRNSILLVDFINGEIQAGRSLEQAVVRAGAIRARPIALTALAAMIGALFILDDPIFNGLAISLIFGIFASTLLTLLVIPVLYYAYLRRRAVRQAH